MAGIHPAWDGKLFQDYCRRFELEENKTVKDFSRGMRMKMSLATALAHRPKLLVMDEATSGLDPVVRGEMLDLFLEFIQDEGHGILMSSHITGDLERIADQIAYIHRGKLLFQQDKDLLLEDMAILRCPQRTSTPCPKSGGGPAGRGLRRRGPGAPPQNVRRLLPEAVLDRADIDEIMQFISGGDKQ